MRARILACLAGATLVSACAAKGPTNPPSTGTLTSGDAPGDAADSSLEVDASFGEEPVAAPAQLRVAQLSPDLPPIDVCLSVHGSNSFAGPLLASISADAGVDSGTGGVAFTQISAYVPLASGQYDARIVPAGTGHCDAASSLADRTNLPTLADDTSATLLVAGVLTGDASPVGNDTGLTVVVLRDDSVLAGGAAELRAINAVPSAPSLDFGLGSFEARWLPLLTNVAFAAASMQAAPDEGAVDSNGYLPIGLLSGQPVSARLSVGATSDIAVAPDVVIPMGAIATVIAVGGRTGDTASSPALLLCVDNQPTGGLADCSIVSLIAAEGPDL